MRIHILGAGWLGAPLALECYKNNYSVSVTYQHEQKKTLPKEISQYPAHFTEKSAIIDSNFFDCDNLIITLPYKRSFQDPHIYFRQIQQLLDTIPNTCSPRIIFTSSTVIYPNNGQVWNENMHIQSFSSRSRALYETEQLFLKGRFSSHIIRLAGLFGPQREPGRFIQKARILSGGRNPINLVHLDDCIGIIMTIIKINPTQRIWNACCKEHPSKVEFYQYAAKHKGLPIPEFTDTKTPYKIVDGQSVDTLLHYKYKVQSPYDMYK